MGLQRYNCMHALLAVSDNMCLCYSLILAILCRTWQAYPLDLCLGPLSDPSKHHIAGSRPYGTAGNDQGRAKGLLSAEAGTFVVGDGVKGL